MGAVLGFYFGPDPCLVFGRLPFFPPQPGWISGVYQTGVRTVSVPHGYDIGFVEEKPSYTQMARSANTVPSCVQARVEKLAVQIYNNCDSDMRVKVVMTANTSPILGAKDSACNTIAPGTRSNVRWIIRGNEKVDRVELC